jgi:hypothetical protein
LLIAAWEHRSDSDLQRAAVRHACHRRRRRPECPRRCTGQRQRHASRTFMLTISAHLSHFSDFLTTSVHYTSHANSTCMQKQEQPPSKRKAASEMDGNPLANAAKRTKKDVSDGGMPLCSYSDIHAFQAKNASKRKCTCSRPVRSYVARNQLLLGLTQCWQTRSPRVVACLSSVNPHSHNRNPIVAKVPQRNSPPQVYR